MLNYNRAKSVIQKGKEVDAKLSFSRKWNWEQREDIKLSSLSIDEVPKSVFSYYMKWSDFIVQYASINYRSQFSFSDITVQHLAEYFAHHRGGKGNLGKENTADHRAKISEAMTGKDHSAETRAAMTGKEKSTDHRAKISKAMTVKKKSADHRAKISEAMTGKERSAETRAAMEGRKHSAETRAKISEARKGSKKRKACLEQRQIHTYHHLKK